jgi:hypothetical protein
VGAFLSFARQYFTAWQDVGIIANPEVATISHPAYTHYRML